MITSPGRVLLDEQLPPEFRDYGTLDKKAITKLFDRIAKSRSGDEYARIAENTARLGNRIAYEYGGPASVHLRDLVIPPEFRAYREQIKQDLNKIIQDPTIDNKEKRQRILDYTHKATENIDKEIVEYLADQDNAFGVMVKNGIRGNATQLRQMVFGDLLTVDSKMKAIPHPTLRSYAEGVSPLDYWNASHGGRYGYVQIQMATPKAGYLSRRARQIAHRVVITEEDCGDPQPLIVDADDNHNIGSLLAKDVKGKDGTEYKKDTVITEDILDNLDGQIPIRSAETCKAPEGMCAKCAGVHESGTLPEVGDVVGLNDINSFMVDATQAAISSKHVGGEEKSAKRIKKGFEAIEQFLDMPENFVGGAVMADADGKVGGTRPAPQGGKYLTVGSQEYWIPPDTELRVKQGDEVEAGDALTDGMINISKVIEHKGIGEARKQFVENFRGVLQDNKLDTQRRALESVARGYLNKVQITDPDGVLGRIAGDYADYDDIAAHWEPRENSRKVSVDEASGYLEQPALHYTIGTRITPQVRSYLRKNGVKDITVNAEPPPFEPVMVRARGWVNTDKDFLTALSGENLTKTFIERASRGANTYKNSTSYFPQLAFESYAGDKVDI